MKRVWITDAVFYLVAPVVIVLVVAALWMSVRGASENYRLGLAFDQSIRVVDLARQLRVPPNISADRASEELLNLLTSRGIATANPLTSGFLGQPAPRSYQSPWDTPVQIFFYPENGTFRLETEMSASQCRRFLSLYAKALEPLGVWRIHLSLPTPGAIWRQIYERGKGSGFLDRQTIDLNCAIGQDSLVSLLFFLKPPAPDAP